MDIISYKKTDVIYRDLEDIIVIKNIRCNEMLTLEDVSADIWRFLVNNNSVKLSEIVSYISEDYGINQNEIVDDIKTFICDLYYAGVVLIDGKYADIELSKDSTQLYIDDGFEGEIIKIYQEKSLIYSVTIELTYSCNENCVHCYANYPVGSDRKELSLRIIKETLIDLYKMKCMHITFTGGDPFMFPGFAELFEFARDLGFSCDIFTNAIYLAEHHDVLRRIIKTHPQAFYISLYGADAQTHETITTVPGSFFKTVFSIQRIREANIPVVLNVMMLKSNAEKIEEIIAFAKFLDADYRVGISLIFKNDGSDSPMKHFINDKNTIKKILSYEKERFLSDLRPVENQDPSLRFLDNLVRVYGCAHIDSRRFPDPLIGHICQVFFQFFSFPRHWLVGAQHFPDFLLFGFQRPNQRPHVFTPSLCVH